MQSAGVRAEAGQTGCAAGKVWGLQCFLLESIVCFGSELNFNSPPLFFFFWYCKIVRL